ncbi:outer membrane beta-barrel protein [Duganella qianjiadongensis]|uniref:Outer membrane beta-barrel protein n=1 Tax=Duganella qianjiadongensis TaxID=2692176 RepID=A0ABW9VN55_9BURK|nr:outer membrane beta-barrel protein [Duganella qianjiadongensis]MYM41029.1 outer membrane beta-barrel protein [Duganella qianjiadongensis]
MLNKIVAAVLITAAGMSCAQTTIPAGSGAYLGASYARVTVKNAVIKGDNVSPSTLGAIFGYDFNQHVALEARLAGGAGSDTLNLAGADFHVKFNRLAGVYAKWSQPIDDGLSVYGVFGATSGKVKVSLGSSSAASSKSSASFGAGLSYQITRSSAVSIEYARLYSDANALSVATRFNF